MTSFSAGDVVAVEFPYSDLQGRKRRPGLVLSADGEDCVLARITTRPPRGPGDMALLGWNAAGLPKPSTVRLNKLATVDQRLVLRRIGRVSSDDSIAILHALENWLQDVATELSDLRG